MWFAPCLAASAAQTRNDARAQSNESGVICRVTENGHPASGTVDVAGVDSSWRAKGLSCGVRHALAPGSYTARIFLEGVLGRPSKTRQLDLRAGSTQEVKASFATAELRIDIRRCGRSAAGFATLSAGRRVVGTVGAGVPVHLSAGTYTIVAKYRDQTRSMRGVEILAGERRAVDLDFCQR